MAGLVDLNVNKGWVQQTFILVIKKIDMCDRSGFCLTELMSRNHFEAILSAFSYVDHDPPVLLDCFFGRFNS